MSIVIGSSSTSTVLDILKIGVHETVKRFGHAEELHYQTDGCEMVIRGEDVANKVEVLTIVFSVNPETDAADISEKLQQAKIPNKVELKNGACCITLPAFEWRQLNQLATVDTVIERTSTSTLRSLSCFTRRGR